MGRRSLQGSGGSFVWLILAHASGWCRTRMRRRKRRRVQPVSMACRPGRANSVCNCPGRFLIGWLRGQARSAWEGGCCLATERRRKGVVRWSARQFFWKFGLSYRYELGAVNSRNEFDRAHQRARKGGFASDENRSVKGGRPGVPARERFYVWFGRAVGGSQGGRSGRRRFLR